MLHQGAIISTSITQLVNSQLWISPTSVQWSRLAHHISPICSVSHDFRGTQNSALWESRNLAVANRFFSLGSAYYIVTYTHIHTNIHIYAQMFVYMYIQYMCIHTHMHYMLFLHYILLHPFFSVALVSNVYLSFLDIHLFCRFCGVAAFPSLWDVSMFKGIVWHFG